MRFSNFPTTGVSSCVGLRPSSHQIDQLPDFWQYERIATARTDSSGKLRMLSSKFPKPPSILVVDDCPSKSVHSKQLAKRKFNRLCLTRQSPMMKSKSFGAAGSSSNGMCYFLYNFNRPVLADSSCTSTVIYLDGRRH